MLYLFKLMTHENVSVYPMHPCGTINENLCLMDWSDQTSLNQINYYTALKQEYRENLRIHGQVYARTQIYPYACVCVCVCMHIHSRLLAFRIYSEIIRIATIRN